MQQKDKRFIFLIIFIILGLVMTVQIRTTLNQNKQKTASMLSMEKLKSELDDIVKTENSLKQSIDKNEQKKETFLKSKIEDKNDEQLRKLKGNLDIIKLEAGLIEVKGPGVTVKLDDAAARTNENPEDIIIHDRDVVRVLNILKSAGAQALSINGERIIATSEQVCAGPTIRINKNRYPVPYEIKAIGNPDAMYDELTKSEVVAELLEFKIRVEIIKSKNITIPKFNGNLDNLVTALEVVGK